MRLTPVGGHWSILAIASVRSLDSSMLFYTERCPHCVDERLLTLEVSNAMATFTCPVCKLSVPHEVVQALDKQGLHELGWVMKEA